MIVRTGNTAHQKARPDMGLPAWETAQKMEQATGKHFMLLLPMTAETSGNSSSFFSPDLEK